MPDDVVEALSSRECVNLSCHLSVWPKGKCTCQLEFCRMLELMDQVAMRMPGASLFLADDNLEHCYGIYLAMPVSIAAAENEL